MSDVFKIILLLLLISCDNAEPEPRGTNLSQDTLKLRSYYERMLVDRFLMDQAPTETEPFALVNATLIEPGSGIVTPGGIIVIEQQKILYAGPNEPGRIPGDYHRVDLDGKYVIPGLVDMHVHTVDNNDQKLLNLINGVTSVREMAGQPWMIEVRNNIRDNRILGPNLYLASSMLNYYSLGMHTTVVKSKQDIEDAVEKFRETGYDYLKIWNNMPPSLFENVVEQAERNGFKLVGHIPQEVELKQAVPHFHTIEHFKGYVSNRDQEISDENYVEITRRHPAWFCPTFYAGNVAFRGNAADSALHKSEESEYISPYEARKWESSSKWNDSLNPSPYEEQAENMRIVFNRLGPLDPGYLAGTDSGGGYAFLVPGFGLIDEIENFHKLGMTALEALQTATTNAAKALERQGKLGTLAKGARADLIVLNKNPLENIRHLEEIFEVIVRGYRLKNRMINRIKAFLSGVYSTENKLFSSEKEAIKEILEFYEKECPGYLMKPHQLDEMAADFKASGYPSAAKRLLRVKSDNFVDSR